MHSQELNSKGHGQGSIDSQINTRKIKLIDNQQA